VKAVSDTEYPATGIGVDNQLDCQGYYPNVRSQPRASLLTRNSTSSRFVVGMYVIALGKSCRFNPRSGAEVEKKHHDPRRLRAVRIGVGKGVEQPPSNPPGQMAKDNHGACDVGRALSVARVYHGAVVGISFCQSHRTMAIGDNGTIRQRPPEISLPSPPSVLLRQMNGGSNKAAGCPGGAFPLDSFKDLPSFTCCDQLAIRGQSLTWGYAGHDERCHKPFTSGKLVLGGGKRLHNCPSTNGNKTLGPCH